MSSILALVLLCGQPAAQSPTETNSTDLYGDPLPRGAISRLGTSRFRQHAGWGGLAGVVLVGDQLVVVTSKAELVYYEVSSGKVTHRVGLAKPPKTQLQGAPEHEEVQAMSSTRGGERLAIYSFVYLPEEARFRHILRAINLRTANPMAEFDVDEGLQGTRVIAMAPDGASIAVGSGSEVRILDVAAGVEVLRYQIEQRASIRALAFSNDSKQLVIGGDNALYRWKWASPEKPHKIELGSATKRSSPAAFDFTGNDDLLAVGLDGSAPQVMLFDVQGNTVGELSVKADTRYLVRSVRFSPDNKLLAVTEYRGGLLLWDVATRQLRQKLQSPTGDFRQLSFSIDGSQLAAANDFSGTLDIFDVATGRRLNGDRPAHEHSPVSLAFLDNSERVISAGDDGSLRLWQTRSGELLRVFLHEPLADGSRWIRAAACSPDGKYAATSSLDNTVRLWNLQTGEQVFRLAGHGRVGGRRALSFTSDGRHFASWGDDMKVFLWEVATGKAVVEYRLNPSGVTIPDAGLGDPFSNKFRFELGGGCFSPGADRLAVHINATLYVFETHTGKELGKHAIDPGHLGGMAILPDSRLIATSQWGKSVQTKLANGRTLFSSARGHPIILRQLDDGSVVERMVLAEGGAGPVAFSPDGSLFLTAIGGPSPSVQIYRLNPLLEVARIDLLGSRPMALAISADNRFLATSLDNMNVLIWDLPSLMDKERTPP